MLRRLKIDVEKALKPKRENYVFFEMCEKQRDLYK
jgi:SNF2 family DNA or RNA helicase